MYRILIADDDDSLREVLREILQREGFEVALAPDGASTLKAALAEAPDLLVLDMNLPDIDGFEVCEKLKADARTRHIPILILTAEAQELPQRVRGLALGADDYMFKPISGKVLAARIRSILKVVSKPTK